MLRDTIGCSMVAVSALWLTVHPASAQFTYFTEPSGFVTLTAEAAVNASTPKYTFVSHSLARQRAWSAVVSSVGTDTLTFSGANWANDLFAGANGLHYLVVSSGTFAGDIYDISSNTPDTLILQSGAGDLTALTGETVTIYKHNTLASVFGADPTVNGLVGASNANNADQIIFYQGGGFRTYFYKNTNIPDFLDPNDVTGWVTSADNKTDVGDTPLRPNVGFIIMRRATTDFQIKVPGEVMNNSINVPIVDSYNLLCVPYPVPDTVTLATSGLYDAADTDHSHSLQPGPNANNAELVVLWNGTGYVQYYFKNENIPDFLDPNDITGWVTSADNQTDAGATPLNGGFFILRKAPNPPIDWVFPSVMAP